MAILLTTSILPPGRDPSTKPATAPPVGSRAGDRARRRSPPPPRRPGILAVDLRALPARGGVQAITDAAQGVAAQGQAAGEVSTRRRRDS